MYYVIYYQKNFITQTVMPVSNEWATDL